MEQGASLYKKNAVKISSQKNYTAVHVLSIVGVNLFHIGWLFAEINAPTAFG